VICVHIATEIDLNDMPYAVGARFDPEKGCLPGTRVGIIDEICEWVNEYEDGPHLFLLIGVAGSGKSAIAHTVAQRFDRVGRLGSSFCFDRSHQAERHPDNIFSTIARDLADLDPQRKQSLWEVIQGKKALRTTHAARQQFEQFILKPTTDLLPVGPIVIVIDALDESADPTSRRVLLSILAEMIAALPSNFRVLVTARAEHDIIRVLGGSRNVVCKYMDTIDPISSQHDISSFVRGQLADISSLDHRWPDGAWCDLLVDKSECLFQWAFTACQFVKGNGKGGLNPAEQLDMLVSSVPQNNQSNHLDQLYLKILAQIFDSDNDLVMARFRSILGRILAVQEPLCISALRELHCGEDSFVVDSIIRPLGSLLSGVAYESVAIRPLHTSFRDFLTCQDRSGSFFVDISRHHRILVFACLRVMRAGLQFNICKLDTSHKYNRDIPDLAKHVKNTISVHLSYACRFWANHLQVVAFDPRIITEVRDFFDSRFLYWLEVLSLTKEVNIASTVLSLVTTWNKVSL
jgi:hypothetical protein